MTRHGGNIVVLAMGGLDGVHVAEDYDLGYSWLETAHQQLQEHPITLDRSAGGGRYAGDVGSKQLGPAVAW